MLYYGKVCALREEGFGLIKSFDRVKASARMKLLPRYCSGVVNPEVTVTFK